MRREQVLQVLRHERGRLQQEFGVRSLALFGSTARDEAEPGSDVDLLIDFERPIGFFHLFHVQDFLQHSLGGVEVDLVSRGSVIPELREAIYGEAIDVFAQKVVPSLAPHHRSH